MPGRKESKRKIRIATQSGTGTGMGITRTGTLGTIIASAPPRAKMAPDAPIPVESGLARRTKRMFPASPPRKNTARKLFSPAARMKKLPRKYRLIILNSMCQRLPWTNILLMMVQGCCESNAGVKPRKLITASGLSRVITKIKTFRAIKNHRTFKLTAR
ncbi:MAG: hypothetical protein MUP49_01940 [Dehalococcoidia bacterium]|nr:hypothetical protein [Dehalococcoidia bacterium]